MAEVTYTEVVWTAGDTITEAKKDNEVANDRAVDAMAQGVEFVERANPSTPGINKVHFYAKDKTGVSTLYAINDAGTVYEISEGRPTFLATIAGSLATGTSLTPVLPVHRTLTIIKVFAIIKTGPTDADLIFDINKNGATIWSTQADRLKITAGNTSGSQTSFNTTALADEDWFTIDIDQIGSTIAGADVSLYIRCK